MSMLYGKVVLFLANGWLKVLRNERCPCLSKNRMDDLRRADQRGQFWSMHSVPILAELDKLWPVLTPQCQFFAVIMPTFLGHCTTRIDGRKKLSELYP